MVSDTQLYIRYTRLVRPKRDLRVPGDWAINWDMIKRPMAAVDRKAREFGFFQLPNKL